MLIGAGDAGRIIIDEVRMNKDSQDIRISCVIDDNKSKVGSYIKGIKICGTAKDIEKKATELLESLIIDSNKQDNIPNGFKAIINFSIFARNCNSS